MNEGHHLPYWKLINEKGKFVIVPQNVSTSSPIHQRRGIYFYSMNYYVILKQHIYLLHKMNPR